MKISPVLLMLLLLPSIGQSVAAEANSDAAAAPLPILQLPGAGTDPEEIDYAQLPTLSGTQAIINPVSLGPEAASPNRVDMHDLRLNLHNYLIHHAGRYWCIWSDGPRVEDWPTQEIRYSTSHDGLSWRRAQSVTGTPKDPIAFIARGFWLRDGELLVLAARFRGKGAFGAQEQKQLELVAYGYDQADDCWRIKGRLYENAINNFPPQRLPSGDWILTRRDSRFNVSMLIGGRKSIDDWLSFPVVRSDEVTGFRPDEPICWSLLSGAWYALFRDNGGSQRLYQSLSRDQGRTWKTPRMTNFPNASSKLFSLRTSRGYRVLVLNANPGVGRRELYLAVSQDEKTFIRLARLQIASPPALPEETARVTKKLSEGIASLQYPHAIEHEGRLWIAFSRGKVQAEMFCLPLDQIDQLLN